MSFWERIFSSESARAQILNLLLLQREQSLRLAKLLYLVGVRLAKAAQLGAKRALVQPVICERQLEFFNSLSASAWPPPISIITRILSFTASSSTSMREQSTRRRSRSARVLLNASTPPPPSAWTVRFSSASRSSAAARSRCASAMSDRMRRVSDCASEGAFIAAANS